MITIDGTEYDVPVIEMRRKAAVLDKYAERTIDGVLHREIIGVYYNYYLRFGTTTDAEEYSALWYALTSPEEFHTIKLEDEDGFHEFEAYISGVEDQFSNVKGTRRYIKNLVANFIAQEPAR
jgi:hypothetical protein